MWKFAVTLIAYFLTECAFGLPCAPRHYEFNSIVCVCNATYCDGTEVSFTNLLQPGHFVHYLSSRDGERLDVMVKAFSRNNFSSKDATNTTTVKLVVNAAKRYQVIMGFGGAMSESAGINIASLSQGAQDKLVGQYFGDEGIGYTFIRIPIGGTDFSTRIYTYDDVYNDTTLSRFRLQEEDLVYKIPYVKKCIERSSRPVRLMSVPWSGPEWMKEKRYFLPGYTRLQFKYYQHYADYFIKFLNAYKNHGLDFWGLSPQNEPLFGSLYYFGTNSMGWDPEEMKNFVKNYLGPTLHANGYENLNLLIFDDQSIFLSYWLKILMEDPKFRDYVSGIAVHWYTDFSESMQKTILEDAHRNYPDKFIMYTESALMHPPFAQAVRLGYWDNAEKYAGNILQGINHWSTGWIDWNLVLDTNGGPTWTINTLDAPIIVNSSADEFYKQPIFYAMAHFSKFVPPGTQRIEISGDNSKGFTSTAFLREDNNIAIVLLNRDDEARTCIITCGNNGNIEVPIPAHSIHTILYKNS